MKKIKLPVLPDSATCHDIMDVLHLLDIMAEVQEAKKAAENLLEVGKKAVKAFMEEKGTDTISMNGLYAKRTKYTQSVFDQSAFKATNPKLFKKFTVEKTRERFSFGKESECNEDG